MLLQKSYMQEYAQKNKKRLSAYKLAWKKKRLEDQEYRIRQNELQAIRRASKDDPDQREKSRIRTAKWKKDNQGKVIASTTMRKKSVKQRTPKWLDTVDLFEIDCVYSYCNALRKVGLNYEVDHIVPLLGSTVSGLHVPSNLQVIRGEENRSKSNKMEI